MKELLVEEPILLLAIESELRILLDLISARIHSRASSIYPTPIILGLYISMILSKVYSNQ